MTEELEPSTKTEGHSVEQLWSKWAMNRGNELRNQIFEYYFPWCRRMASSLFAKYNDPTMSWHDYVSIVSVTTLSCIEKYDPEVGVPFEGYAFPRIKGSILNTIRSNTKHYDCIVRESLLDEQRDDSENDGFNTIVNLAIEMALSHLLEHGALDSSGPSYHYEKEQTSELLNALVDKLPKQQKFVLKAYYFQQLSTTQISELLGLSKARVSQIHKLGIYTLRSIYEQFY